MHVRHTVLFCTHNDAARLHGCTCSQPKAIAFKRKILLVKLFFCPAELCCAWHKRTSAHQLPRVAEPWDHTCPTLQHDAGKNDKIQTLATQLGCDWKAIAIRL
jgi:hypothetical protein